MFLCILLYMELAGVVCVRLGVCGDVAIGCTNNNYASREKCKKCGQPKEVAASLQSHLSYFDQLGSLLPFSNQASALKEWRSGDWICTCGFHNYSSRIQVRSNWFWSLGTRHFSDSCLLIFAFLCVYAVQKVQ